MIERKMERKENQIERVKKRENKIMVFKQPKKRKKKRDLIRLSLSICQEYTGMKLEITAYNA